MISLVVLGLVNKAIANFNPSYLTTSPKLTTNIGYPRNSTICSQNKIFLSFSAEIADWTDPYYGHQYLDPTQIYLNCYLDDELLKTYTYTSNSFVYALENLTDGQHEAKVVLHVYYPTSRFSASDYSIVYFTFQASTSSSTPLPRFTPLATLTLTSSPNPTIVVTEPPSPSPSIPEFPLTTLTITSLAMAVLIGVISRKKRK
jgi:hypothetical protein